MDLAPGALLVARPTLLDPNFRRAVLLLCDHNTEGSFGLVLNRPTPYHLPEVLERPVGIENRLYLGGPVQTDTLHFLHPYPDRVPGAEPVLEGVAWGGPFDAVVEQVRTGELDSEAMRFFAGYAGWGEGQLVEEVEEESWLVLPGTPAHVFARRPEHLWRDVLRSLGGEWALWANFPDDPRMN